MLYSGTDPESYTNILQYTKIKPRPWLASLGKLVVKRACLSRGGRGMWGQGGALPCEIRGLSRAKPHTPKSNAESHTPNQNTESHTSKQIRWRRQCRQRPLNSKPQVLALPLVLLIEEGTA